jgi:hypothetical protein
MMEKAKPVFDGISFALGEIGKGLSGFFKEIGKSAPDAKIVIEDLGRFLKYTLIAAGNLIGFLARQYVKFRLFVKTVAGWFQWLLDKLVGDKGSVKALVLGVVEWFAKLPGKIKNIVTGFVENVKQWWTDLGSDTRERTKNLVVGVVEWFRKLPGKAWDALSSWASKMHNRAAGAGNSLVSGVRDKISDAVRWVGTLPSRAKNALGNLGSYLWNSGRSLIGGFISGIRSMISEVKNAAFGIVDAARQYFPFSPAKKGPFSGRGWTLYSGRSLIRGFEQGIAQQGPSLRRQMQHVLASMPALVGGDAPVHGTHGRAGTGALVGAGGPLVSIGEFHAGGRSERQIAEELAWLAKGRG